MQLTPGTDGLVKNQDPRHTYVRYVGRSRHTYVTLRYQLTFTLVIASGVLYLAFCSFSHCSFHGFIMFFNFGFKVNIFFIFEPFL